MSEVKDSSGGLVRTAEYECKTHIGHLDYAFPTREITIAEPPNPDDIEKYFRQAAEDLKTTIAGCYDVRFSRWVVPLQPPVVSAPAPAQRVDSAGNLVRTATYECYTHFEYLEYASSETREVVIAKPQNPDDIEKYFRQAAKEAEKREMAGCYELRFSGWVVARPPVAPVSDTAGCLE